MFILSTLTFFKTYYCTLLTINFVKNLLTMFITMSMNYKFFL